MCLNEVIRGAYCGLFGCEEGHAMFMMTVAINTGTSSLHIKQG